MSRLDELVAARKSAFRVLLAASDAATEVRRRTQRDDPVRALAEEEVNEARRAYDRRRSAAAGPQLDLLLGAGGGR